MEFNNFPENINHKPVLLFQYFCDYNQRESPVKPECNGKCLISREIIVNFVSHEIIPDYGKG